MLTRRYCRTNFPLRSKFTAERGVKSVVIPQLGNKQSVFRDLVNDAVFFVDSPRPVTSKAVFERLWLADSFKWLPLGLFDQLVDSVKSLLSVFCPGR